MSGLIQNAAVAGDEPRVQVSGGDDQVFDPDAHWYAVWTRSRQEKAAAATLKQLGIQHYLPLTLETRQWSDRKQTVEAPLFSGYLFVRISLFKGVKLQVLKVPGLVALVGNQMGPSPIPNYQIEGIRTVLTAGVECAVQPLLQEGDRVRVVRGALAGVEGTLLRTKSTSRLLISIEMIRQSLSVNVLREDVEPMTAPRFPLGCFPQSTVSMRGQP